MKKCAIVILNWNGENYLNQFLPAVIEYSENHDIIVIDNASTDDSVQLIKEKFSTVRIVQNDQNGGFAKGYNDGLDEIKGEYKYYLLLNSDIEVTPNWTAPLLKKIASDETIFSVQPKVLAYHNKNLFEHAGASGGFIDANYYPFCRGRIFDFVEEDQAQYDNEKEVFWTTGACMIVDAQRFHSFGGFDEDFFAHMEEIDLCWRAKLTGMKVMVSPTSTVYHVGGGTLNYQSPRKTYLNFRNNLFMIHKNHKGILFFKICKRLHLDGIAGFKYFISFKFNHLFAITKAHLSYYASLPKLYKKRKQIKKSIANPNLTGIYQGSIIFAYFIKRIKKFSALNKRLFNNDY